MGLFTVKKRRLRETLISTYKYPKGGCNLKVNGARLSSVVPSDRTRVNGRKLKSKKFPQHEEEVRLRAAEPWNRLLW